MSAERLKLIKDKRETLLVCMNELGDGEANLQGIYNDMGWLIQQAERVQELEQAVNTSTYIQRMLRKEERRLREALEFYADEAIYRDMTDASGVYSTAEKDSGQKARKYLEQSNAKT